MAELNEFLAWCTLINLCLLGASTLLLRLFKTSVMALHSRWFAIDEALLPALYFRYLANYKLAFLIFNFVPYLALSVMA